MKWLIFFSPKQSISQQMIMAYICVTGDGVQSKGIILIDGINCKKALLRKCEVLALGLCVTVNHCMCSGMKM